MEQGKPARKVHRAGKIVAISQYVAICLMFHAVLWCNNICFIFLGYNPCTEMLSTFVIICNLCSYHTPSLSLARSVIDSFSYSLCSGKKIIGLSAAQVLTILSYNRTQGRNMSHRLSMLICVICGRKLHQWISSNLNISKLQTVVKRPIWSAWLGSHTEAVFSYSSRWLGNCLLCKKCKKEFAVHLCPYAYARPCS
jgi:hypothetical protein